MDNCYHCGDDVVTEVRAEDKLFCCQGCVSVYNIINSSGLTDYYKGEQANPGISNKKLIYLDYLEAQEVQSKLITYKDEVKSVVKFVLPSIHCASCVWLLERLGLLNKYIISSEVDFLSKRITICFDHNKISLKDVGELLLSIGYEPKLDLKKGRKPINHLIIRIGVAGFCFGNIMLLSFPEYLNQNPGEIWVRFFSYLSVFLSIPVFTYCAIPFYKGVSSAWRAKKISVDILIVVGILTLLGRSLYEILALGNTGYLDSLAGLLFFLLIGKWFQAKVFSELSFEKDNSYYLPLAVLKKTEVDFEVTPLKAIKKGDILRLRNSEVVPFKCALNSKTGLIDNSFITGEELPVQLNQGDLVYCGAQVKGELIEVIVADVENGDISEMWRDSKKVEEGTNLVNDRFITVFTYAVFGVAVLAFIYWSFFSWEKAFLATTSVLIVACPCALALSAPIVYGLILRKFSQYGAFVKNANAIKKLSGIKTVVFDKTGTITNKNVTLSWEGQTLKKQDKIAIASISQHSSHPLAKEITKQFSDFLNVKGFKEEIGKGATGVISGVVYKIGSNDFVGAEKSNTTSVYVAKEGEVLGRFIIKLSLRDNLENWLKSFSNQFKTLLLSGDPNLNKEDYNHLFPTEQIIKNASPLEKSRVIQEQNDLQPTLMVGDGINDSLAFDSAALGFAVVEETGAFFPSCDGIIKGEQLNNLPFLISVAKYSKTVLIACFTFSIIYNSVGLYFAVNQWLTPLFAAILMPLSSVSVAGLAVFLISLKTNKK